MRGWWRFAGGRGSSPKQGGEQRTRGKRPGAVWARSLPGQEGEERDDEEGLHTQVPRAMQDAVNGTGCPGCGVPLQCEMPSQPGCVTTPPYLRPVSA
jgi:hypothetical protein